MLGAEDHQLLLSPYFPTFDTIKKILTLQSRRYWHNKRGASKCAPQNGPFLCAIRSSMKVVPSTFSMDPVSTKTAAKKAGVEHTEMIGNTLGTIWINRLIATTETC
jgi:hypothetical protein